MMKPQKKPVEYDDDSDVELLSISSGDEDLPANRGGTQRDRNGGDQRRGGGMADDDMVGDHDWDCEEPNCWKQVDEAEVFRFYPIFSFLSTLLFEKYEWSDYISY